MKHKPSIEIRLDVDEPTIRFWQRAFWVYVASEAFIMAAAYITTYIKCSDCVLPFPFNLLQFFVNLLFTSCLWWVLNYIHRFNLTVRIFANIFIFISLYFLYMGLMYVALNSQIKWLLNNAENHQTISSIIYGSWIYIGKYVLLLSAFYVLKFYEQYRRAAHQRLQLALVNKDLQINLLKQQLNPHFYFNTLNNLYSMSRSNNALLTQALHQLNNIMRYVIEDSLQTKVPLQQELEFLQSYIALEKLRYEENTSIEFSFKGEIAQQQISPLLLVQFVENAFKHGMKEKLDSDWMKVQATIYKKELYFKIENSCHDQHHIAGIGIQTVKNLLQLQYPDRHLLQMEKIDGCFSVTLNLSL